MSGYIQSDMEVKRMATCLGEAEKILRENTWGSEAWVAIVHLTNDYGDKHSRQREKIARTPRAAESLAHPGSIENHFMAVA